MKKLLTLVILAISVFAYANEGYSDPKEIAARLKKISSQHPDLVKIKSLTKTPNQNDVWAVTIGSGDVANNPAVAVVAGVDSRHMVGIETALRFIEQVVALPNAKQLLAEKTFYVFPCVNPDATINYFGNLKFESNRTKSLYDNDRDGSMSEDGPEDMDNNKLITKMIVEAPNGEYIKHPNDSRVLIKADASKGEQGKYMLYTEGTDNDNDGLLNEDGVDGVDLNRNFTYLYKNWGSETGNFAVSEVENRALLDFMYEAYNIHTVFTFGTNDNMAKAPKLENKIQRGQVAPARNSNLLKADNTLAEKVSKMYLANNPKANNTLAETPMDGNFLEWGYYHYGRNSFGTYVWNIDEKDERSSEAAFLKWADKNNIKASMDWTSINHPDFEDQKVEVGSLIPYAMFTPPINLIEKDMNSTIKTVIEVAELAPKVEITNVKVEKLEKNLSRVTAQITNTGNMPTVNNVGLQSVWLKYIRVEFKTDGHIFHNGVRLSTIPVLLAGQTQEMSWIIEGNKEITLEAGCPQAGYDKTTLTLK